MAGSGSAKKVLVVTYYWPPSGGAGVQRFLKFVKYFRDYDIEPVVLTCANPTYPFKDPSLADDIPKGIEVHYARTIEPFRLYSILSGTPTEIAASPVTHLATENLSLLQRLARWIRANLFVPDARIGWVPFAVSRARKLIKEHQIDTVITTGPPHSTHLTGKRLKDKTGIRWIADFRDPWSDIHYNRALPRTARTHKKDERMESSVLQNADDITVTAPGTARLFADKVERKYYTIPNGFDPDDFETGVGKPGSDSTEKKQGVLVRHVGSITETSVPENLLNALSRLSGSGIQMEFVGNVHQNLHQLVSEYGLENDVRFHPYVAHKKATLLMQKSDVNVVVVHRSEDSRILIPGKLYDYLNAGRPVMVIGPTDGDAATIVESCRIGMTFDYDDVEGPAGWLEELRNGIAGFSPKADMIARYSRPVLTKRYADLLQGRVIPENYISG